MMADAPEEGSESSEKVKKKRSKKEKKAKRRDCKEEHTNSGKDKKKKRKRDRREKGGEDGSGEKKKKKRKSKEKTDRTKEERFRRGARSVDDSAEISNIEIGKDRGHLSKFPFDYKYILAPMVGASELAFRLLCRKYGAHLAYTPMISSAKFASDSEYRKDEFQTVPEDRPLVCHFSANDPKEFAAAAKLVEDKCDAIDLNLGCPQRTAYVGHFGSYLLDKKDRELVLDIVRAGTQAVSIPIFAKIRLLDTLQETIELCCQLRDAGASLIAVHARYRASFERKGPGARDGPALLDQVMEIKAAVPEIPIISNGNVISYGDVLKNLELTKADGIMTAEGILDNPALFLPRWGPNNDAAAAKIVKVAIPSPLPSVTLPYRQGKSAIGDERSRRKRKLIKLLKEIEKIKAKIDENGAGSINEDQKKKFDRKQAVESELNDLMDEERGTSSESSGPPKPRTMGISLKDLYETAGDPLALAEEYLNLVRRFPVKIRSVVFHTRRMCKAVLNQYQLMEDCVACKTIDEVSIVLQKMKRYRKDPNSFQFDMEKSKREKEALEKKRREEGKRKAYEARMMRKAKREGKADLEYYLRIGAEIPTVETIERLRSLSKEEQMAAWKVDHSQHCMAYHLDPSGCKRDRTCAFLHVDAKGINTFDEREEVAG